MAKMECQDAAAMWDARWKDKADWEGQFLDADWDDDCSSAVNLVLYDPGFFDERHCRDGGRVEEELHADADAEAQRFGWKGACL